jgi:hypothetical protein
VLVGVDEDVDLRLVVEHLVDANAVDGLPCSWSARTARWTVHDSQWSAIRPSGKHVSGPAIWVRTAHLGGSSPSLATTSTRPMSSKQPVSCAVHLVLSRAFRGPMVP